MATSGAAGSGFCAGPALARFSCGRSGLPPLKSCMVSEGSQSPLLMTIMPWAVWSMTTTCDLALLIQRVLKPANGAGHAQLLWLVCIVCKDTKVMRHSNNQCKWLRASNTIQDDCWLQRKYVVIQGLCRCSSVTMKSKVASPSCIRVHADRSQVEEVTFIGIIGVAALSGKVLVRVNLDDFLPHSATALGT
eukprot:5772660-Amphidinium_carterae.1